jgi:geranylgeranyl diphosphate synthase type II
MYSQVQLKEIIERAITNLPYNNEAEKLTEPVKYVLSIGGKRLRPLLSLMTCNLFSDKVDDAVMPSAGIEVFHNFTLVHDDIMDSAPLRRGLPTVHNKWNLNQAVLSGDVMAFIANECFLQAPSWCMPKVFAIFNRAAVEVCVGQQQDMDFEKSVTVSEQEYLRMIELKTAVLLAASARIGAVIGGASDKDADLAYKFGRNLGMAFQLQDDLLDVYGDTRLFGKVAGGDIVENKKTFLFIRASEMASGKQQRRLHELFSTGNIEPHAKVQEVIKIYDSLNVREVIDNNVKEYITSAVQVLDKISVTHERKDELSALATLLAGRER